MKSFKVLRSNHLQQCCRISNVNLRNYSKALADCSLNKQFLVFKAPNNYGSFCRYFSKFPSHTVIKLPNLSPTMETGNIVSWAKAEGDELCEGDLLAEIETDKATMALDASEEGYLAKILLQKGAQGVPVGTPLCITVESQDLVAKFADFQISDIEDSGPRTKEIKEASKQAKPEAVKSSTNVSSPLVTPTIPSQSTGERTFVTPLAKNMAQSQGITIPSGFQGSGYLGSVTAKDLSSLASSVMSQTSSQMPSVGQFTDIKLTNMRSTIAKRLLESKQTIPHYYLTIDINMDEIIELRTNINQKLSKTNESVKKISLNDMIVKAASMACMKIPDCNSSFQGTFIRQFNQVDMCIAVATENGLITPIIPSSESKSFIEIAKLSQQLAAKAKEGKLQPHEFQGGTFTISNLGMMGIDHFSAIINPPQACILAIGNTEKKLIPDPKSPQGFKEASFMKVTLCCDHRVVDGAVGAQWLKKFREMMEEPAMMLL